MKHIEIKSPRAADKITIAYQVIILLTILFHYPAIANGLAFSIYHLIIIAFLLWLPHAPENKVWQWIKNYNPVIIIPTNFAELHFLVNTVNPIDFDNSLIEIDRLLFGVDPTVWLEKWSNPYLVEYLQLIYTTFYFLPIILAVILIVRGEKDQFDYFVYLVVLTYYISYLGYFIVPAVGPRFTLVHLQSEPLTGLWLTDSIRQLLDTLENIQRDAFPSGHTMVTLVTMIEARKHSKWYYIFLLVVGISLIFSTVYLRYHYVIDVIAGIVLVMIIRLFAVSLYKLLNEFRTWTMIWPGRERL